MGHAHISISITQNPQIHVEIAYKYWGTPGGPSDPYTSSRIPNTGNRQTDSLTCRKAARIAPCRDFFLVALTIFSVWITRRAVFRVQEAQHIPNTSPADLSRQFKPQAVIPAPAHKKTPDTRPGELGRKRLGRLVVWVAARAFLAKLVLRVVRVIIGEFGRHLELLARVQMKLNGKLAAVPVSAGQGEQVPPGKLLARCLQFWCVIVGEFSLRVDQYVHRIVSFFLEVETGQPRPVPHLLQN